MTLAPTGLLESPAPSIGKSLKQTGISWNRTRSALVAMRLFWTTSLLRMRHGIRALIGGVGTITRKTGFAPVAGARTTDRLLRRNTLDSAGARAYVQSVGNERFGNHVR